MTGSVETLSMVQPPSLMMESLPSLTGAPPAVTGRRPSDVRLECRHTLSGKLGSSVPVTVRRALGGYLIYLSLVTSRLAEYESD